jgi:hypothetical protein
MRSRIARDYPETGVEFIDENGGGPGVAATKATPKEGLIHGTLEMGSVSSCASIVIAFQFSLQAKS